MARAQAQDPGSRAAEHSLRRSRPRAAPLQRHAGRIGAIAKGVRRPRSRFGGRLEPFFCLDLVLHQGRGDLATVTAAHTVEAHLNLRANGPALGAAARACDAVLRLLDSEEANPAAYNLLCRYLAILDGSESVDGDGTGTGRPASRRRSRSG